MASCNKATHTHIWSLTGDAPNNYLQLERCEKECYYCLVKYGKHHTTPWGWHLRRHVRSVHVGKDCPELKGVYEGWKGAPNGNRRIKRGEKKRVEKKPAPPKPAKKAPVAVVEDIPLNTTIQGMCALEMAPAPPMVDPFPFDWMSDDIMDLFRELGGVEMEMPPPDLDCLDWAVDWGFGGSE